MTIGDVAKDFDLSIDTLRYYEKLGLLKNVTREHGKRKYGEDNIKNLQFILCMKSAGLSLKDIGKFIEYHEIGDDTLSFRLDILKQQKVALENEIIEKQETLNYLNQKIEIYTQMIGGKR